MNKGSLNNKTGGDKEKTILVSTLLVVATIYSAAIDFCFFYLLRGVATLNHSDIREAYVHLFGVLSMLVPFSICAFAAGTATGIKMKVVRYILITCAIVLAFSSYIILAFIGTLTSF